MITASTIEEVRSSIRAARRAGKSIGLVPTMGFLHEGHLSLIDRARAEGAGFVAVSVFVNPMQFGPGEDFERYPRDEARDRRLLEGRRVDLLFQPRAETLVTAGNTTRIDVGPVAVPLEGERRPGHFAGVATIVMKLFNIVQPDLAVFGRKDAQQCAVIQTMVRDLDVPVKLVFGETLREPDGLALSSRNSYLSSEERGQAPALQRVLQSGADAIARGICEPSEIRKVMNETAKQWPALEIDYLAVIDPETFALPAADTGAFLLAGAARVGRTRLIDNIRVERNR